MNGTDRRRIRRRRLAALRGWLLPLAAFTAVSGSVLGVHALQQRARVQRLAVATRITAEQVALRIEAALGDRFARIDALAGHGAALTDSAFFRRLAESTLLRHPDLQAVNWVDTGRTIRITVPARGNEGALGRRLGEHPSPAVRQLSEAATRDDSLRCTPLVPLLQGGVGFASYRRALDEQGRLLGLLNAVFRIGPLLAATLPEEALHRHYSLSLADAWGETLYERSAGDAAGDWQEPQAASVPVRVADGRWTFRMAPGPDHPARQDGGFHGTLPWIGLLLGLSMAGLTRRQHLQALRLQEGEERYRSLFEQSLDGIFISDEQGRLVEANAAALDIVGCRRDEALGSPIQRFFHDDEEFARVEKLLAAQGWLRGEEVLLTRGAATIRCLISAVSRRSAHGEPKGLQGILSDITEAHRVREQLRQAQKMEAVGQLAGGVAHDFNNLLTVITGNAELAQLELGDQGPGVPELAEIRRTAARAASLTRQLLAFSRRQVIRPRRLDGNEVVRGLESMLRRLIGETIELHTELGETPWTIRLDPSQLEQVLLNLAVNARDAMPEGGRLTIRSRNRRLPGAEGQPPQDSFELEVEDTGCGMDPEVQERIFEPFFTTKVEGAGTGLGLATVYGIIKQNGGSIEVESRPGEGSLFRLRFPRIEGLPEAREGDGGPLPTLRGHETVLVVEDEAPLRRLTVEALRRQGYRVLEAEDGLAAAGLLAEDPGAVDLILSDIVMPRRGGLELLADLRARGLNIPAIFLSGYASEVAVRGAKLPAGSELLSKPYELAELLRTVRRRLDGH
jgi:PAS domain S-box-containing protein